MNQPLSNESMTLGHDNTAAALLHPSLRRALGVLDARLEDELERYRRYRAGLRLTPSAVSALRRSMTPPALDLPNPSVSLDLLNLVSQSPAPTESTPAIVEAAIDEEITVNQTPAPNAAAMPPLPPRTPLSFQNNLPPDASSALVLSALQDDADSAEGLIQPEDLPQYGFGFGLGDGFATDQGFGDAQGPNDYLESSEELLRSLAEEEATVAAERNVLEGLLTPMGVGSMLLMLLGSGMFGYLIMNPASLNAVKGLAMKVASFRSNSSAQPPANVATVDVDGPTNADGTWMSNSPALDANEFLNLSLGNISALRTRPGGLNLISQPGANGVTAPLQQLDGKTAPGVKTPDQSGDKAKDSGKKITGLTPLNIKPIVPPTPAISRAGSNSGSGSGNQQPIGNIFTPSRNYEPAPAPRYNPPSYTPPSQPARSYEPPRYEAPAYKPEPVYIPPIEPARTLPPAPVVETAPIAVPEPQREYRVEAPYTSDADLEAIQKDNPNAAFRNGNEGANIGASYSSQAEADAAAARWREKGVEAEVK